MKKKLIILFLISCGIFYYNPLGEYMGNVDLIITIIITYFSWKLLKFGIRHFKKSAHSYTSYDYPIDKDNNSCFYDKVN